jgi:hypothetical protein
MKQDLWPELPYAAWKDKMSALGQKRTRASARRHLRSARDAQTPLEARHCDRVRGVQHDFAAGLAALGAGHVA